VLSITGLEAGYLANRPVMKNINVSISGGETLAVVGESGSGKSSLARVVVGLLPRWTGDVRLAGQSLAPALARRPREALRRLQMVHQMPDVALNPRQTVAEIIGRPVGFFFDRPKSAIRSRVAELVRLVGLPEDLALRRPGQLSGGQKQRVCIARARGGAGSHHLRRADFGAGSARRRGDIEAPP
jgi:peptide/nickel transport system ATP-binding protein